MREYTPHHQSNAHRMMSLTRRHVHKKRRTKGPLLFWAPVAIDPSKVKPEAHDGVRYIDYCSKRCGAWRERLEGNGATEYGPWRAG